MNKHKLNYFFLDKPNFTRLTTAICVSAFLFFSFSISGQTCDSLFRRGMKFVSQKEYDQAVIEFQGILSNDQELAFDDCEVRSLYSLGRCYLKLSKNIEALKAFEKYLSYPEEVTDSLDRMKARAKIPDIYRQLGLFERALKEHISLMTLRDSLKDKRGLAQSNYELGTLFHDRENYVQAIAYLEVSKEICEELKDTSLILRVFSSLGTNHRKLGQLGKSLYYNQATLDMAPKTKMRGKNIFIGYAEMNMGSVLLSMGELVEAEKHLEKSVELFTQKGYKHGLVSAYLDYGHLFDKKGEFQKALTIFQMGLELSQQINAIAKEGEFHQCLANVYKQLNRINDAYYHLEIYSELKDSIINKEQQKRMDQIQFKYELERNAREIVYLKQERDLLLKKEMIDRRFQQFYIASFTLVVILLSFFIYGYRLQKKNNAKLKEKNEKINEQNDMLQHLNAELKQFASIASHDMREPLRSIGAFASLLERQYGAKLDASGKEYLHFIRDAVNRMTSLLADLLNYTKLNSTQTSEWIDLRGIIQTSVSNLHYQISSNNGIININHKAIPYVKAVPTQMMQLFQNLISNALKFRRAEDPYIEIDGYADDTGYILSIKDNGIGIDPLYKDKIFGMFSRLNNKEEFEGTGIGLATCRKIIHKHSGRIWVDSAEEEGSTFYIWLPKKIITFSQKKVLATVG